MLEERKTDNFPRDGPVQTVLSCDMASQATRRSDVACNRTVPIFEATSPRRI